ncbi:hypothetical protein TUM4438_31390 [Shewanella sairae]|uniref:Uncharacterized protein n=1 Tax=Shewanella sairae TaxID=190310 RepID=A0ABQ4PLF0_9GAMM|nr:hypothetical protein [Shewanella sairae]MCL1131907.1 hypothetical protein [Shewanella sairae]GIU48914.1 hypothetical protein TUM4438_31390 [Shewanella sairae]
MSICVRNGNFGGSGVEPQLESLDAVVSLSAENPNVLFNLAKTLAPELADIQLPTNGNAIELNTIIPMPEEIKISPKLAIKGEHIVLFAGEKGEAVANALGEEPLVSNGLMVISTDYRKIFKPLLSLWDLTGESIPEDFNRMKDYNMRSRFSLDVEQKGFEVESYINYYSTQ